jgi:SAM-dependent methyltransferase
MEELAEEEKKSLKKVYDTIADSWTHLRARPLEEVIRFCHSLQKHGLVLDIGCSNCRNLIPFLEKEFPCVGFDFSKGMIREAKKFLAKKDLTTSLLIADAVKIPFKNKIFDYVLYTRTLHHLPTKKLRIDSLSEIKRITKNKGKIFITVWRRYYPRFLSDIFSNLFTKKFEFGDTWKKWTYHGKVYKRFYHLYTLEELKKELKEVGMKIESTSVNDGNIITECEIE